MASNPSTPLPEQGGFNERLDAIAEQFEVHDPRGQFADAIRTLVLEEIIGEDWPHHCDLEYMKCDQCRNRMVLNGQKYEQRKKLGGH